MVLLPLCKEDVDRYNLPWGPLPEIIEIVRRPEKSLGTTLLVERQWEDLDPAQ